MNHLAADRAADRWAPPRGPLVGEDYPPRAMHGASAHGARALRAMQPARRSAMPREEPERLKEGHGSTYSSFCVSWREETKARCNPKCQQCAHLVPRMRVITTIQDGRIRKNRLAATFHVEDCLDTWQGSSSRISSSTIPESMVTRSIDSPAQQEVPRPCVRLGHLSQGRFGNPTLGQASEPHIVPRSKLLGITAPRYPSFRGYPEILFGPNSCPRGELVRRFSHLISWSLSETL